jgi:predicted transcriptional regulator YdeE
MSVTRKALFVIERNHSRDLTLPAHQVASADAPSIERHKETFDPRTGNGGVDIWIPIDG